MENKSCEERVNEELEKELSNLRLLWEAYCSGEEEVEDLGNIFEYGLSFDYVAPNTYTDQEEGYFRYQLSWGGPSDEFRFYTDLEYIPYRIEYWFLDWFDGASRRLYNEDFDFMKSLFIDLFVESGTASFKVEEAR